MKGSEAMKGEIRSFITSNFLFNSRDSSLADDTSFLESGTIDSTGVLELVGFLEKTFGVKIEDEELLPENLDSINSIARFIGSKKGGLTAR